MPAPVIPRRTALAGLAARDRIASHDYDWALNDAEEGEAS